MQQKILVLDNYDSFTYNLVHYIEANGHYSVDVYRNDEILLEKVEQYHTIILSPGPGLPKDAGILKELINKYAPTKKILGVCLGMQAIAEVYGGQLENLDNVYHGVETPIKISDIKDILFKDIPEKINVGRYHSWVISKNNFPNELIVTSLDEDNNIMSLRHKDYKLYGVQFHPESILTEYGKKFITNFLNN